jgi:hypothetical protein
MVFFFSPIENSLNYISENIIFLHLHDHTNVHSKLVHRPCSKTYTTTSPKEPESHQNQHVGCKMRYKTGIKTSTNTRKETKPDVACPQRTSKCLTNNARPQRTSKCWNIARPQWTSKLWSKTSSSQGGRGQEGSEKTKEMTKQPLQQTPEASTIAIHR